jgi:hypothetical protein
MLRSERLRAVLAQIADQPRPSSPRPGRRPDHQRPAAAWSRRPVAAQRASSTPSSRSTSTPTRSTSSGRVATPTRGARRDRAADHSADHLPHPAAVARGVPGRRTPRADPRRGGRVEPAAGRGPDGAARRAGVQRRPDPGHDIARTEMLDAHRAAAKAEQEQHADVLAGLGVAVPPLAADLPVVPGQARHRCTRSPSPARRITRRAAARGCRRPSRGPSSGSTSRSRTTLCPTPEAGSTRSPSATSRDHGRDAGSSCCETTGSVGRPDHEAAYDVRVAGLVGDDPGRRAARSGQALALARVLSVVVPDRPARRRRRGPGRRGRASGAARSTPSRARRSPRRRRHPPAEPYDPTGRSHHAQADRAGRDRESPRPPSRRPRTPAGSRCSSSPPAGGPRATTRPTCSPRPRRTW